MGMHRVGGVAVCFLADGPGPCCRYRTPHALACHQGLLAAYGYVQDYKDYGWEQGFGVYVLAMARIPSRNPRVSDSSRAGARLWDAGGLQAAVLGSKGDV